MKIGCVLSSLGPGGAERVMSTLANRWAECGHGVSLITLGSGAEDFYPLDPRVQRVALSTVQESVSPAHAIALNVSRIRALRRAVGRGCPDVVISFNAQLNVLTIISCLGFGVPVIVSERTYPPAHDIGPSWALLRRWTYRFAAAIVVQTTAAREWASTLAPSDRVHVIPNAVNVPFVASKVVSERSRLPIVLGVGRLAPEKGFDVLIRAFGTLAQRHPTWSLTIVGEGSEEGRLKALAAELLPPGRTKFPGKVSDPETYYRVAALFVLPSRFEGFPNALLESMASGCAVIATDCQAGPSEIVRRGVDGILVAPDDVMALAREMDWLMSDEAARDRLGSRAREVTSRFGPDYIAALWDDVVARVRRWKQLAVKRGWAR